MAQANQFRTSQPTQESGPHFVVPRTRPSQPPHLKTLQADIERIVTTSTAKLEAIQGLLQLARSLTNASEVVYALDPTSERSTFAYVDSSGPLHSKERKVALLQWSRQACESGQVQLNRIDGVSETIVTLPVFVNGSASEAIHAALLVPRGEVEPFIVSLQLIATGMTTWFANSAANSNRLEASISSAVVELIAKCNAAETAQQAHYVLVTELQRLVNCDSVAFAERRRNRRYRVRAISATAEMDQKTNIICDLNDCAAESDVRSAATMWPPLSIADRHTSLVHQQFVQNHSYEAIYSVPIDSEAAHEGVLIFMGRQTRIHDDTTIRIVTAVSPHIAGALLLRKQAEAGPFARFKQAIRATPEKRKTRRGLLIGLVLATVAMLVPIPHKVACDCTVEPTIKRYATVPFDGILEQSYVKPGDIVKADQLLAKMDDRDLRFERSEASAARTQALKEADVQLAKGKVADAQIAQLKATELQAKLNWVRHRENHLDIKSLIDGVVIEGDLDDAEGASVRQGQVLFEVAPLESLKLKLDIPEEDIAFVDQRMMVTARLDGAPGKKYEALLAKIKPRASAESGENVFTAEASLTDIDGTLRPGMSGTAKVIGPTRPVGWIVFHRAYRKVVDFIDW